MGIPFADHIMNAVVLTAVLSCLNSGLYTASRMLFVLAARREAPAALMRGEQARRARARPSSASTVVGFLCVIAAAVSPDTVFLVPAELLRRGHPVRLPADRDLAGGPAPADDPGEADGEDVAVPGPVDRHDRGASSPCWCRWLQRGGPDPAAAQPAGLGRRAGPLLRSTKWRGGSVASRTQPPGPAATERVLVLANETVGARRAARRAAGDRPGRPRRLLRLRPGQPVDTGQADRVRPSGGAGRARGGGAGAARPRRWRSCAARGSRPTASSATTGRCTPWPRPRSTFRPDRLVISTHPEEHSAWLRYDVVDQARDVHSLPVTHVVSYVGRPVAP